MKAMLPLLTALLLVPLGTLPAANAPAKPNIIVILADDLGYADLGCQGSAEVKSPQIDSIAANGVRCTAGYVSAPQCCPSRAGLMTGRCQNRFGFEANWSAVSGREGLPLTETTMADRLKAAGYVTGMIGKWHLGDSEPRRPYNRGFTETLWHPNGGVLLPDKKTGFLRNLHHGSEPAQVAEYSTDAFGREATEFIGRHRHEPFFLYLAFVPPHWPMEAKPEHLARFAHVPDLHRRTFLAMMASLDENVGRVLAKLRETGLEEKTLVFFLSDNGGPTGFKPRTKPDAPFEYGQNTSRNDPCRGVKGDLLEGGIRVPFLVQWKGKLPAGKTYDQPVISLDILPSALAVAGVKPQPDWELDGTNLLPFLMGENRGAPHEMLFWRFRFPPNQPARHRWAIRQGDWKLVKNDVELLALHNLANDIGEKRNLAAEQPDRVRAMAAAWQQWNAELKEPLWVDPPKPKPAGKRPPGARHAGTETSRSYRTAGGELLVRHDAKDEGLYFDVPPSEVAYNVQILRLGTEGYATVFHAEPRKVPHKPGDSIRAAVEPGPFRFTMPTTRPYVLWGDLHDKLSPLYSPMDGWNGTGNPMVIKGPPGDPFYYVFFLAVLEDSGKLVGPREGKWRHALCQARTRDFREFELRANLAGRAEWKPFRADSPAEWRRPWLLCDVTGERIQSRLPVDIGHTQGLIGSICFHEGAYWFFYADVDTDKQGYLFMRKTPDIVNLQQGRTQWSAATRVAGPLPTQLIIRVAKSRDGSRWAVLYNGYRNGPKGRRQDLFLQYTGDLTIGGPKGLAGLRWFDDNAALMDNTSFVGLNSGGGTYAQHCFVTDPYGRLAVTDQDDQHPEVGGMLTWADFTRGIYHNQVYWAKWKVCP